MVHPSIHRKSIIYGRRLGDVVDIFTNNISLGKNEENKDLLGCTYEYCLAKFAQLEGKNAGEFYTPACVVRTLVSVIEPFKGRVYDPTCGSGGMFVQSADFVKHHQGLINNISIYGQEINANTWKMCKMNLAIRNLEANLGESNADTLMHDNFPTIKMDFGLSNPPFNMSDWEQDKLQDDPRWKYGIPPAGNANFAFMEHLIYHMSPQGRVGMVLANGSLSSQTGGEGEIRKNILEDDLVEGIVALPSQLFYSTQIPVCLWFLSRRKEQPGKVLFVDARNMGEMVSRRNRELSEGDINHIAGLFNNYRRGELKDEKGLCAVKSLDDIREQDYILTPGRYVGIAEQEDDGEPFEEKMNRLTTELSGLFTKSHRLENEIQKQLASIGFKLNF
ncbi:MAG: SAM-dependent methyltransferase [Prevotella sp.]|nr:SAM-dependent methyltransferase [Prevotella sp.]